VSEHVVTGPLRLSSRAVGVVAVASYTVLGSILASTRLVGLDRSYWHDEIVTIVRYVRAGPREILAGSYIPNNHELFSLLTWATTSLVGESEIVVRLWSVIPFILGVIVVTTWLHVRGSALSGLLFLFFASVSPLLLDLSRQARGYGLAFLAMSVLIVAALEADRSGGPLTILAFCAAGVAGTWTLPHFGVAFVGTGAALLANTSLRRGAAVGMSVSILAICAWYAPVVDDLLESSHQAYGVPIETEWLVTAPIDQILIPALVWIDGTVLLPGVVWLPVILGLILLLGSSPLLRDRGSASIVGAGVVATAFVIWLADLHAAPRFLSFLLVPLFILLASGTASVLARLATRPPIVRTVVALTVLGLLAVGSASTAAQVTRLPREAHKDAAGLIERRALPASAVFVYAHQPADLAFYLDVPVQALETSEVVSRVCKVRASPVVYVMQPFVIPPVDVPCLRQRGVRHHRFEQYTRGDETNVWLLPPRG